MLTADFIGTASRGVAFSRFSAESVTEGGEILYGLIVCEEGKVEKYKLMIDEGFLDSIVELGNSGPIKLRINHPGDQGDVLSIVGEGKNFRRGVTKDGAACVRCDGYMINPTDEDTKKLLSLAHQAPHLFGMSIDAHLEVVKTLKNGWRVGKADTLNAVDFVDRPASTSSLFSKPVDLTNDNRKLNMEKTQDQITAELEVEKARQETEKKLGLMMEQFSTIHAWCSKKMKAEEDEEKEKKDKKDKEDKKMEDTSETLKLEKENERKEVAKMTASIVMEQLNRVGVTARTSNPDAELDKGALTLSADELKIANDLKMDESARKQFAANLAKAKEIKL